MRLAVNIDHFATLREARKAGEPEPVLVALLAEQAGAHGIVCHIRSDRRHIKERDLRLLRAAVKTKLNVEMAATEEMKAVALDIKPDVVSLVPERPEELTTEGGLKVVANRKALGPHVKALKKAGIRTSIFIDTSLEEIGAAREIGVDLVEINTGKFADLREGPERDEGACGGPQGGGIRAQDRARGPRRARPRLPERRADRRHPRDRRAQHRLLHRRPGGRRRHRAGGRGHARPALVELVGDRVSCPRLGG